MRTIARFQASAFRIGLLFVICGVAAAPYSVPLSQTAGKNASARKASASGTQSQGVYTLDIALYGPVALLDCSEGMTVRLIAPDVPFHEPVKVGNPGKFSPLSKGEYKLLNVRGADRTDLVNPVRGAEALIFPVEDACAGIAQNTCPYVCIDLPRPMQIAPWDADPMRVVRPGENPANIPWRRLARVLLLRYEVANFQGIQLSRTDSNATLDLQPDQNQAEGILTLALDPLARPGADWRQEARDSFRVLITLLGLRGHLEFPGKEISRRYKRNELRIPGVLPSELTDSLPRVQLLGTHGDCLGPEVLVMDVQPK